jgi:hypothetical protein
LTVGKHHGPDLLAMPAVVDRHAHLMIIYSGSIILDCHLYSLCVYFLDVLQVSREEEKRSKEEINLVLGIFLFLFHTM